MKRTPLKRFTPLKIYARLKSHALMNPVSKKQAEENKLWAKIKAQRIEKIIDNHTILICEYCHRPLDRRIAECHHNDRNRAINTLDNARIIHGIPCHRFITDNNVRNVESLLE